jgi:hypothetical protein
VKQHPCKLRKIAAEPGKLFGKLYLCVYIAIGRDVYRWAKPHVIALESSTTNGERLSNTSGRVAHTPAKDDEDGRCLLGSLLDPNLFYCGFKRQKPCNVQYPSTPSQKETYLLSQSRHIALFTYTSIHRFAEAPRKGTGHGSRANSQSHTRAVSISQIGYK